MLYSTLCYGLLAASLCLAFVLAFAFSRSAPLPASEGRFGCTDGLRGYLALAVFAHHFIGGWHNFTSGTTIAGPWLPPDSDFARNLGVLGVTCFFLVSGFVFYRKLLGNSRVNWRAFYISRFFRLMPLYVFAIAVVALVSFHMQGWTLRVPLSELGSSLLNWLFLTKMVLPPINGFQDSNWVIAGITWTLRYEWLFYLAMPLVAGFVALLRSRAVRCILLVIFALVLIPQQASYADLKLSFVSFFVAGMISAEVSEIGIAARILKSWPMSIAGAVAVVLILSGPSLIWGGTQLFLVFAFFSTVAAGNTFFGLLTARPSLYLGLISYSIYLFHGLFVFLFFTALGAGTFATSEFWPLLLLIGPAIVLFCSATFFLIEAPGMQAGKALAGRTAPQVRPSKSRSKRARKYAHG